MDTTALLNQINSLSLRDTKTLSQKGLKAAEEVGELARAILPLEGAYGTNHRLPCLDKVSEECADIILVAYSIMASLGLEIKDVMNILQRKADYWQFLIDNEDKTDINKLHFEIHVTVTDVPSLEAFQKDCNILGAKPIILDLYTEETTIKDIMTSSKIVGTTKDAVDYTKKLGRDLRALGYNVVREKIETVPWHPAAQIKPNNASAYFEAHLAFEPNDEFLLNNFAKMHDIHLSRNAMKKGDKSVTMGTYRVDASLTNPTAFDDNVALICKSARALGLHIREKPHTEYSLFDTNERHDGEWVNG